jgi:hypothetical protein
VTAEQLLDTIRAALDERLTVEEPPPFGRGIIVSRAFVAGDDLVVVAQPGGPHFAVRIQEAQFEVAL